jgi:hypothetical protein
MSRLSFLISLCLLSFNTLALSVDEVDNCFTNISDEVKERLIINSEPLTLATQQKMYTVWNNKFTAAKDCSDIEKIVEKIDNDLIAINEAIENSMK